MKNQKNKNVFLVFIIPLLFLIIGTGVLKDYGFNWDEPFHFMRGQAYLNYFLSGKKDYSNLSAYPRLNKECPVWAPLCYTTSPGGATDILASKDKGPIYQDAIKTRFPLGFLKPWRSLYQNDTYDFNSIIIGENGHPPLNDILGALTNYIFFQRLHLIGDDEAYHFFEVFVSFLIVFGISIFVYKKYSIFPAVVAGTSLALYPVFFSESHFNIKDPPEAAFFGLTIILFYFGITKNKWKHIILSAIFSAFALGTKFNALFIAPILGIWLSYYLVLLFKKYGRKIFSIQNLRKIFLLVLSLAVYPFITLGIFYALWPYLWPDPLRNIMVIIDFYRQIGTGGSGELVPFLINGWNTYPIQWIIYTTPIPILFLSLVGLIRSIIKSIKGDNFSFLVLLWFIVPILRVSWPNTTIYGGIRQIMEYVPAMAVLAGIGAYGLLEIIEKKYKNSVRFSNVYKVVVVCSLLFVSWELVRIHPNENVYFNQLIGGLSGAKEKNIPAWGNAYGNVYLQGVNWINKNAEPNAKLGLAVATMGNVPKLKLRTDIDFFNGNYSGLDRKGEYVMEMDFDWWPKYFYSFQYLDTYLEPVYVVKVDGVPIFKVWKNDLTHTKEGFKNDKEYFLKNVSYVQNRIFIDLGKEIFLTSLKIEHSSTNCDPLKGGYIATSVDNAKWQRDLDPLEAQVPNVIKQFNKNSFIFLFPARKVRYILLDPLSINSCLLKSPWFEIRGLEVSP